GPRLRRSPRRGVVALVPRPPDPPRSVGNAALSRPPRAPPRDLREPSPDIFASRDDFRQLTPRTAEGPFVKNEIPSLSAIQAELARQDAELGALETMASAMPNIGVLIPPSFFEEIERLVSTPNVSPQMPANGIRG